MDRSSGQNGVACRDTHPEHTHREVFEDGHDMLLTDLKVML